MTYADAITLLMAFFVMMFSISDVNPSKYNTIKEALAAEFTAARPGAPPPDAGPGHDAGVAPRAAKGRKEATRGPIPQPGDPLDALVDSKQLVDLVGSQLVQVERKPSGIVFHFSESALYDRARATLRAAIKPMLRAIARTLALLPDQGFYVEVEGHTDDVPLKGGGRFRSNWHLAALRATNVVDFLVAHGVDSLRLKAVSYAHTRPRVPSHGADGRPIPANRARNRRVVIRIDR